MFIRTRFIASKKEFRICWVNVGIDNVAEQNRINSRTRNQEMYKDTTYVPLKFRVANSARPEPSNIERKENRALVSRNSRVKDKIKRDVSTGRAENNVVGTCYYH